MPEAQIFSCQACGASLSVSGEETQIQCQHCGSNVVVPESLRARAPRAPQVIVTPATVRVAGRTAAAVSLLVFGLIGLIVLGGIAATIYAFQAARPALSPLSTAFALTDGLPEAAATPTPGFAQLVLSFGGEGTGPGRFDDARGIALDGQGNIYTADLPTGRVQKFDAAGQFLFSWVVEGQSSLSALAADRAGNVYASRDRAILKYDGATGQLLSKIEGNYSFDDVVALPNVGLLAYTREDFVYFNAQGQEVGRLSQPIRTQTGKSTTGARLAVDGPGNIYALADFESSVFKFNPQGQFVDKFGGKGDAPGQFEFPMDIALDSQGRVYVSDSNRIHVFTADGSFLDLIEVPGNAIFAMVFSDDDKLFALSRNAAQVFKFALTEP